MIGLLDYDALASQKIRYPNLELMKMATYLRRIRQSFRLIVDFSDLEIYNEIYLFQNDSTLPYPSQVFRKKNVKWFGLAFTDNVYRPMAPEIEECEPSIGVYKLLFKEFLLQDKMTTTQIGYLLNASYVRLSMPLNKRYIRTIRPNRRILVYDTNVFSGDWEKNVESLVKREIAGFIFLYEQELNDIELWAKIFIKYPRRTFNYNEINVIFEFDLKYIETIIQVYRKIIGENKKPPYWLRLRPVIVPPYKENVLLFVEGIGAQMRAGVPLIWRDPPYKGNPYHPFVDALCAWAGGVGFSRQSFMDYLIEKDLHRERRFAQKLITNNKKYRLIFSQRPTDIKAMYGGLQSYETRRNRPSLYRDYLNF